MESNERDEERIHQARVDSSGRIVLPVELRERQGIQIGDGVVLLERENCIRIQTLDQAIRESQALFETGNGVAKDESGELIDAASRDGDE